MVTLKIYIAVC